MTKPTTGTEVSASYVKRLFICSRQTLRRVQSSVQSSTPHAELCGEHFTEQEKKRVVLILFEVEVSPSSMIFGFSQLMSAIGAKQIFY